VLQKKLKMEKLFEQIGLTPLEILIILVAVFLTKELWAIFKNYRIKAAYEYLSKSVDEIDLQLKEFYLPLRERLITSKLLHETTNEWLKDGEYDNELLQLVTDDKKALRKITVWKLFLPFNNDIQKIILENLFRKHIDDKTNYEKILKHILIWKSFEESIQDGLIEYYDAEHILIFPADEAESCIEICNRLLKRKEALVKSIMGLGLSSKKQFSLNQ
jgi:hypothetical protein